MIIGKLIRIVAIGTEYAFFLHMLFVFARVVTIELAGSTHMAAFAIGVDIEGSCQPVRCRLTAMAADITAVSAGRIIRKTT